MTKKIINIDKDLEDLVPTYLESRKKELLKLNELMAQRSFSEISSIAHKIAGNAGGYGFDELTEIGRRLEASSKAADLENSKKEIENIAQYLEDIEVKFI